MKGERHLKELIKAARKKWRYLPRSYVFLLPRADV